MKSRFCLVIVIFYFTAILICTVYLRNSNNRVFYQIYKVNTEQERLRQQLRQKQLQLEVIINPAAVRQRLKAEE